MGSTPTVGVERNTKQSAAVQILASHIVGDMALTAAELTDGMTLTTLFGSTLTVGVADDGTVTVTLPGGTTATVITPNVVACEAVVHVIDTVLVATGDDATATAPAPADGALVDPVDPVVAENDGMGEADDAAAPAPADGAPVDPVLVDDAMGAMDDAAAPATGPVVVDDVAAAPAAAPDGSALLRRSRPP